MCDKTFLATVGISTVLASIGNDEILAQNVKRALKQGARWTGEVKKPSVKAYW